MLFNSYTFLLGYLPVVTFGFFLFARWGKTAGASWLAFSSLAFYSWWDYRYLFLLIASICTNYCVGGYIARHSLSRKGRIALGLAVAVNLSLLGYYKYADFFIASSNVVFGTDWQLLGILLPIGISFFTFTQIAFLADAYVGKVAEYRFVYYVLFVTYFPHLIAGPVLHHKEMMPQFDENKNYRANASNFAIGLSIFAIGLAKKVLIADNLAVYVAPVFAHQSDSPTFFLAWGGVLAYTFQLYFDFSGYSDMAIGLSRMFGVRLPLNFNSPYKAINIADFWRRWHMSLSRFLRDYLYIPLGGNRQGMMRRQINLMITMVLGGLWHGAGWNFAIWGGLHGAFLVINQLWQFGSQGFMFRFPKQICRVVSISLTFFCVVFAWVYFRAPDLTTANHLVFSMLGCSGASIPEGIFLHLGPFKFIVEGLGIGSYLGGGTQFIETWCWVIFSASIAFFMPNTQEIMSQFEPALAEEHQSQPVSTPRLLWQPNPKNAVALGILLALGVLALSRPTEFLYFQF